MFYDVGINAVNEATDKVPVKPLFVQFTPFTEKVDYGAAVIVSLFIGILLIIYAQLSWLYLIVLRGNDGKRAYCGKKFGEPTVSGSGGKKHYDLYT